MNLTTPTINIIEMVKVWDELPAPEITPHTAYNIGFSDGIGTTTYNAYKDITSWQLPTMHHHRAYYRGWQAGHTLTTQVKQQLNIKLSPAIIVE